MTELSGPCICPIFPAHLADCPAHIARIHEQFKKLKETHKRSMEILQNDYIAAQQGWRASVEDVTRLKERLLIDTARNASDYTDDVEKLEAQCAALREALIGASLFYSSEGKICFQPAHCLQSENRHEECLAAEQALRKAKGEV